MKTHLCPNLSGKESSLSFRCARARATRHTSQLLGVDNRLKEVNFATDFGDLF